MEFDELEKEIKNSKNNIIIKKRTNENDDILNILNNKLLQMIVDNTEFIKVNYIIRIFGSKIKEENDKYLDYIPHHYLIIANDVFGGLFALNKDNIMYFAIDTLEWESLDIDYPQFIIWVIGNDILSFYEEFIDDEIKNLIPKIDFNSCIQFYPYPYTKEFNINSSSKKIISSDELIKLNFDVAKQIDIL